MSLYLGKYFVEALRSSEEITELIDGRLFPVARSTEDDLLDKIPYIIMMPSGITAGETCKDDYAEGDEDQAQVNLLVCAQTYDSLVTLTQLVRDTIHEAYEGDLADEDWPFVFDGYEFSADAVQYDPTKPCYYQTLRYNCTTTKQ